MNLANLSELLLTWARTQGAALLQGGKAEPFSPFKVGATYEGKVLDQLVTGRLLVQIAGQKLDMALPRNTQAGDTVRLTFLNAGPRPTFLLNQAPVSSAQSVQLSNTAQQVSTLMQLSPPPMTSSGWRGGLVPQSVPQSGPISTPSNATAISSNGGGVSQAGNLGVPSVSVSRSGMPLPPLLRAMSSLPATATAGGTGPGALPTQPPTNAIAATPTLPAMAQTAVSAAARPIVANVVMLQNHASLPGGGPGGLPGGLQPTMAVASANTALLGQAVDALRAAVPTPTSLMATVLADPAAPSSDLIPARLAQALRESGLFYESHLAKWTKGAYPFESLLNEPQARLARAAMPMSNLPELANMPEDAARLAGRQLHQLEGAPFVWQGFAWPGQWMDWLVEERQNWQEGGQTNEQSSEEAADQWQTELRLTLPQMGAVHAQIQLRGGAVGLQLTATDVDTAARMRVALPSLQRGLENAGLQAHTLHVEQGEA